MSEDSGSDQSVEEFDFDLLLKRHSRYFDGREYVDIRLLEALGFKKSKNKTRDFTKVVKR
jgi:hypothetical protein